MIAYKWQAEDGNQTPAELAYIGLFGGILWECIGTAHDGHLDTAFGNSETDAQNRAIQAGLK